MKKKLIIAGIALLLTALIVFGAVYAVNYHKDNVIKNYADTVSVYFEAAKAGNNLLMSAAGVFESYSGGFSYDAAFAEVENELGLYNGMSYDVDKAYETVVAQEIKYDEMQSIKDSVLKHYEQYKIFEDRILNQTKENYNENYGRIYKDWQKPFAEEHHKLRSVLAAYR